jgi:RNA methyltransferase, TrmH family
VRPALSERPEQEPLTNPRSDRVRAVARLSGRSARQRAGRFLVEGPQAVREAVRFAPAGVRELYVTDGAARRHRPIVDDAVAAGIRVRPVSDEVLAAMVVDGGTLTPQGLLAVCDLLGADLGEVLAARPVLVAVLSQVRDPGNAGTVIRAADAAGADAVVLTGASVDVHNPKVVRSTAGSLFHLPVVTGPDLGDVLAGLRGAGLRVLAADGAGDVDLDDLADGSVGGETLTAATAWVFGNEAWGLRDGDRALADAVVRVPVHGRAESLNLATAATVCLYASARAQRRNPRVDGGEKGLAESDMIDGG